MPFFRKLTDKKYYAVLLLAIIYVVGFIGLNSPLRVYFETLTPINLMITAIILFRYHKQWTWSFTLFCLFVFVGGYLVELVGITSGLPFGRYHYESTLGPRLAGVPMIIGLNWLILIYSIGVLLSRLQMPLPLKILGGSLMMVLIDVFIEPVAIEYDFWQWEAQTVPFQNYIGWFVTSLVFLFVFFKNDFQKTNKIAPYVYYIQLIFFLSMTITIKAL